MHSFASLFGCSVWGCHTAPPEEVICWARYPWSLGADSIVCDFLLEWINGCSTGLDRSVRRSHHHKAVFVELAVDGEKASDGFPRDERAVGGACQRTAAPVLSVDGVRVFLALATRWVQIHVRQGRIDQSTTFDLAASWSHSHVAKPVGEAVDDDVEADDGFALDEWSLGASHLSIDRVEAFNTCRAGLKYLAGVGIDGTVVNVTFGGGACNEAGVSVPEAVDLHTVADDRFTLLEGTWPLRTFPSQADRCRSLLLLGWHLGRCHRGL